MPISLELLCGHGPLPHEVADNLREWENCGFNVHIGDEVSPGDTDRLHFLGRYLKKCPVALNDMELVNDDSMVRYQKSTHDDAEHKDFSPLEFLAALSVTVPGKWEQTVRYYGIYSARGRANTCLPSHSNTRTTPTTCSPPALNPSASRHLLPNHQTSPLGRQYSHVPNGL